MMDFRDPKPARRPEPVVPFVNVALLLVVFVLLAGLLAPAGTAGIEPPQAAAGGAPDPSLPRLELDVEGIAHFDGLTGSDAIAAAARAAAGGPLALGADRRAPGRALARALAALHPLPVLLVVEPE